jgi:hypothetical protein
LPDDFESRAHFLKPHEKGPQQSPLQKLLALFSPGATSLAPISEDHVLSILAARRARESALGPELFSDPGWDLLLELYAARLAGRTTELPELARSIRHAESTTARWIAALSERRLLVSLESGAGPGRLSIELSEEGAAAMKRLLDYWSSAFRSI